MKKGTVLFVCVCWCLLSLVHPLPWQSCEGGRPEVRPHKQCAFVTPDSPQAESHPNGYTWYEARDICLSNHADLVSWERGNVVRRSTLDNRRYFLWTGLNSIKKPYTWEWSDTYSASPDTYKQGLKLVNPNTRCAAFNWGGAPDENLFRYLNCGDRTDGFICKRRFGRSNLLLVPQVNRPTPAAKADAYNCPPGWKDPGTDRCYKAFQGGKAWGAAEKSCLSLPFLDPTLASANTQQEIDSLTGVVKKYGDNGRMWFGLFRESPEKPWMWIDNSRMNATNLHRYFDLERDYGGGVVDYRALPPGAWDVTSNRDGTRGIVRHYICQIKKDPQQSYN